MTRRGFTILEALIALAILGAVVLAAMQVRAQTLAATHAVRDARAADNLLDAVAEMVLSGAAPDPEIEPTTGAVTWSGTLLDRPWTAVRTRRIIDNPIAGAAPHDVADRLTFYEYDITIDGHRRTLLWHE